MIKICLIFFYKMANISLKLLQQKILVDNLPFSVEMNAYTIYTKTLTYNLTKLLKSGMDGDDMYYSTLSWYVLNVNSSSTLY